MSYEQFPPQRIIWPQASVVQLLKNCAEGPEARRQNVNPQIIY